jgi:hypothetical protein
VIMCDNLPKLNHKPPSHSSDVPSPKLINMAHDLNIYTINCEIEMDN